MIAANAYSAVMSIQTTAYFIDGVPICRVMATVKGPEGKRPKKTKSEGTERANKRQTKAHNATRDSHNEPAEQASRVPTIWVRRSPQ